VLSSLVVNLKPEETHPLDIHSGHSIQALFFSLLEKGDKKLSKEYHDSFNLKPFTVSPLLGSFGRSSTSRLVIKDFNYWIRFTFLEKEGFEAFSRVIFPLFAENKKLTLNGQKFYLTSVNIENQKSKGWSGISSFEALLKEGKELAKKCNKKLNHPVLSLSFFSPTTFRRGDINYLFPEPSLVFQSYLNKWNLFSPFKITSGSLLNYISNHMVVSSYRLQTKVYSTGDVSLQGFSGTCRYTLLEFDFEFMSQIFSLAEFSFYAGTGQKTTMGMGMTKPIIFLKGV